MRGAIMPLCKSPAPSPDQTARLFFPENVILLQPAENDVAEPALEWPLHAESPRKNITENDERSLNVIENTGYRWGTTWNVIDKTGG
jgi:hypothetical protein